MLSIKLKSAFRDAGRFALDIMGIPTKEAREYDKIQDPDFEEKFTKLLKEVYEREPALEEAFEFKVQQWQKGAEDLNRWADADRQISTERRHALYKLYNVYRGGCRTMDSLGVEHHPIEGKMDLTADNLYLHLLNDQNDMKRNDICDPDVSAKINRGLADHLGLRRRHTLFPREYLGLDAA